MKFARVNYNQYGHRPPSSPPLWSDLLDEERLLLELRDGKKLIWHNVAKHFNDPRSELYSVAGLQARYERLKERQIQALIEADFLQRLEDELRGVEAGRGTSMLVN